MRRMLDEKDVKDISLETIEQKNLKPVSGTVENNKWKTITIGTETHGFAGGAGGDAVWGDITGDIADQTDLKDALDAKADSADLATVATTGDYDDLLNKPTIPDAVSGTNDGTNWTSLTIGSNTYDIPQDTPVVIDGKTILNGQNGLETAIGGWHESGPGVNAFDDDNTGYKSTTEPEFEIDSTGYDGPCELFKDILGLGSLEPNVFSDYNYKVEVKQNGTTIWLHESCPIAWNSAGPSGSVAILINKASSIDRISLNNVPSVDANTFRAKIYPQGSASAVVFDANDVVTLTIKKLATNIYHKINPSYVPLDSSTLRVNQSGQITVVFPSDFVTTYGNQSINGVKTILSSIGGKLQFKNWYSEDGLSYWQQLQDCSLCPGFSNTTHSITANYIGDYSNQNKAVSTIYFDKDASYNLAAGTTYVKIADIATAISDASTAVQPADLAAVATTGDYDDLINKPDLSVYALSANLATVATSGDYTDLINTPDLSDMATETWVGQQGYLTSVSWNQIQNIPTFATVATSGSYNDLSNKPTILGSSTETWTFTLSDNTTVTKTIVLG